MKNKLLKYLKNSMLSIKHFQKLVKKYITNLQTNSLLFLYKRNLRNNVDNIYFILQNTAYGRKVDRYYSLAIKATKEMYEHPSIYLFNDPLGHNCFCGECYKKEYVNLNKIKYFNENFITLDNDYTLNFRYPESYEQFTRVYVDFLAKQELLD